MTLSKRDLVFDPGPTQEAFVESDAHIVVLIGPMGEGKTYAGAFGPVRHALRCGRDIRGALIRDTHQNIKISTAPDIKEIFGDFVEFKDDFKKMIIHSQPKVEMDLFGIDDPAALSKLQGPQYAIIWLEEPAPIIARVNAGLPRGVFDMAVARAARQKNTIMRVQITQNPADEDHWTEEVFWAPRVFYRDPKTGAEIIKACFRIPVGENRHLSDLSRAANAAAFQSDPGKFARYVEGRAAPVRLGSAVVSTYSPQRHYLQDIELPVTPDATGVRLWDAYHHPACLIGQLLPPHRLVIHDVVYREGVGVRELIENDIKPLLASSKYKDKIFTWRDIGDPSMQTPDQSTVNQTTANVIYELLGGNFEPGPTRWPARIDPAITAFNRNALDGQPLIQLSRSARFLHRALNGGWFWKVDNTGNAAGSAPVKNQFSHVGDALLYGVAILFPFDAALPYDELKKISQKDRMSRAMSYAMAGHRRAGGGV